RNRAPLPIIRGPPRNYRTVRVCDSFSSARNHIMGRHETTRGSMKNTGIRSSRVPSALLAMLLAVCAAASPSALRATDDNQPPVAAKKSPWTPEDVVNQEDA